MGPTSRRADESAATFHIGEFTFDCESRQLTRGAVKRHLSPKAQQLLWLLLAARPRALSREELYDALWPSTFVCETNLASVVNEIRRALGDDARAARYIRTVHRFGYAFCGEVATSRGDSAIVATLLCGERRYWLRQGENLVGRSPECRVVIDDTTISRRHAVISVHEGACTVRDRDSMNGTFVDGRQIGRTPVIVTTASRIVFGSLEASIRFQTLSSTDARLLDVTEVKRRMAERHAGR